MSVERPFISAENAEPAAWIVERLTDSAINVLSVVPSGFEAYARVFHPAEKVTYTSPDWAEWLLEPIRWTEVAALTGRTAHRTMQWASLNNKSPVIDDESVLKVGDVWVRGPEEGSLPLELAQTLWPVLEQHTKTPDACFFAVWEGFGGLPKYVYEAPAFEIPERRFHLFRDPIQTVEQSFYTGAELDTIETTFMAFSEEEIALPSAKLQEQIQASLDALNALPSRYQSTNLWWPEDKAWFVHTEIDFNTTYIGGPQKLIDAVLASKKLEVYQLEPTDEITYDSDTLNLLPDDPYGCSFKL